MFRSSRPTVRGQVMRMLMLTSLWLVAATACTAQAVAGPRPSYDGHWWLSISAAERSGLVAGYMDCYTSEFKGPANWEHRGFDLNRDSVTQFYQRDSSRLSRSISDALYEFRDRPGDVILNRGGERVPGPHGFFNGIYWRQMFALEGHAEQLGFVEGYLYCHEKLAKN